MKRAALVLLSAVALAQSPAFDVASIRRNTATGNPRVRYNPAGIDFSHAPLEWIIGEAYQVQYARISSPDSRIQDEFFSKRGTAHFYDITARAESAASKDQIRAMLQALLRERFHLTAHRESKTEAVFMLRPAKSGPKLQESAGGGEPSTAASLDGLIFRNMDMNRLSGILAQYVGRPVLDRTGLTGTYDFSIKANLQLAATPDAPQKVALIEWLSSGLPEAMERQVGLKLEPDKAPVDYLVVEHVEQPSEN